MKTMMLTLALLIGAPLALFADVSKEELKKLAAAGIPEGVILSYVRAHGPLAKLSAEDVIELKRAGVTESLLAAALSVPRPAPRPSPTYVPPSDGYSTVPSYSPSVVYDDLYPGNYYSGDWGYGYPAFGLGLGYGYYGGRYCGGYYHRYPYWGGYYGNRSWNGYNGGRFYGGHPGYGGYHGGGWSGGHGGFGGGGHGGGGHGGGGGHR